MGLRSATHSHPLKRLSWLPAVQLGHSKCSLRATHWRPFPTTDICNTISASHPFPTR